LTYSLESEGYEVHTQLEYPEGPPIEDIKGPDEDREKEFLRRLQTIADSNGPKKALILKTSHIGGHKYSGNVVVSSNLSGIVRAQRQSPSRFTRHRAPAYGTDA